MNFFEFFCLIVTITCAIGANLPRQKCVTNADGKKNCVILTSISPTVRSSSRSCSESDILCWNEVALSLVNDVRRQQRKSALTLGPQSQLNNAMNYAAELAAKHDLYHQNLRSVTDEVRCMRWIGGENLAFNYDQANAAAACVDQWIKSPGHYENLVRDNFEQVVLGLNFKRDGSVFCVQTFSYISRSAPGSANDPGCGSISGSSGTTPQVSSAGTTQARSTTSVASNSGSNEGRNSCLCLHYSRGCTSAIASSTGGICTRSTSYRRQGASCVSTCCDFCSRNPGDGVCQSSRVRKLC